MITTYIYLEFSIFISYTIFNKIKCIKNKFYNIIKIFGLLRRKEPLLIKKMHATRKAKSSPPHGSCSISKAMMTPPWRK